MCEAEHEARHWQLYVQDMCEFSEKVLTYTEGSGPGCALSPKA